MKKRTIFRVGQKVQSIYEPGHQFVIDRSMVPPRIYRERRSNRWWAAHELQPAGALENPLTSLRLNGKAECVQMRGKCVPAGSGQFTSANTDASRFPPRECLECGAVFQPVRDWQRFHSTPCRYAYWQRQRSLRKGPRIVAATA